MNLLDRSLQSNAAISNKLEEMPTTSKTAVRKSWAGTSTAKKYKKMHEGMSSSPKDVDDRTGLLTAKLSKEHASQGKSLLTGKVKREVAPFHNAKLSGQG